MLVSLWNHCIVIMRRFRPFFIRSILSLVVSRCAVLFVSYKSYSILQQPVAVQCSVPFCRWMCGVCECVLAEVLFYCVASILLVVFALCIPGKKYRTEDAFITFSKLAARNALFTCKNSKETNKTHAKHRLNTSHESIASLDTGKNLYKTQTMAQNNASPSTSILLTVDVMYQCTDHQFISLSRQRKLLQMIFASLQLRQHQIALRWRIDKMCVHIVIGEEQYLQWC